MRRLSLALAVMLVVAMTSLAGAQSDDRTYEGIIRAALQEYELEHWAEATALFERAHAMRPSARTLRGLSLANFENRQYVKAWTFGRQALESDVRPLAAKQREHLEGIVARADDFIARFDVSTDPEGATLMVDGYPVVTDAAGSVMLDPGDHELVARLASGQSEHRKVVAESGRTGTLTIRFREDLEEAPVAERLTSEPRPTAPASLGAAEEEGSGSVGPWIVMGTGGAILIASAITGVLTKSAEDELVKANCEVQCAPSYGNTVDRGEALQVTTNILLGVGVATVVGGAVWWLLDGSGEESEGEVTASAACVPGFCGASVHTSF